jgi:hypothetical protein
MGVDSLSETHLLCEQGRINEASSPQLGFLVYTRTLPVEVHMSPGVFNHIVTQFS